MAKHFTKYELFFANMLSHAEMLALLSFVEEICHQIGLQDPDGLSVADRFYTQRKVELEKLFRSLEDQRPALAARIHEMYEAAVKKLGDDRS